MATFTTSDGLSLYYDDRGEGLPLLCLSGLTRDSRDFEYVMPHLTGCRVIRLDYRGRGKSDFAEDALSYTIPREAQDVLELLAHLGLARVAVLGTSRGGLVAMALAMGAPDALIGVALNDIGPAIAPAGLEVIMGYLGRQPVWKTYDEAAAARPGVMAGFANVPERRWRAEVEKFYDQTDDGLRITYDPKLRDAVIAAGAQPVPDLWPMFDALEGKPLALIRGANSDLLSPETLAEMQARRPDAHVAVVPDRGHVPFLDEPEALTALGAWLKDMA
ncbi:MULTISPECIES: alpha/beta fold hydrolase [Marinovum]|uniref:alpha/beta fold hydrolase n=1 Tax=Marinovum TaxID=367771 RepID=UPI00237A218B|nr:MULTISPECIES: alpha/beta hydrolase [Marinovum]MDD9741207.1 alpha/beta hydrolase [Marinovum sp. SP66]MDD9743612.1 alpha/beta hydrolase [Marinovum sp. PR37]